MSNYSKERDKRAEKSRQLFYNLLDECDIRHIIAPDSDRGDKGIDLILYPKGHSPIIVDHKSYPISDSGRGHTLVAYSYGTYGDKKFKAPPHYPGCKTDLFVHTPINQPWVVYWKTDIRISKYPLTKKAISLWHIPSYIVDGCISYVVKSNSVYDLKDWLSNINNNYAPRYNWLGTSNSYMKDCKIC